MRARLRFHAWPDQHESTDDWLQRVQKKSGWVAFSQGAVAVAIGVWTYPFGTGCQGHDSITPVLLRHQKSIHLHFFDFFDF